MKNNKKGWQKISSKVVHKNPWYSVQKDDVVLPNGENGEYFIMQTGKSVFIVPVKGDKIIFVRQYRYVFDDWFLELPGGGVEDGEKPLLTAKKELREESGYISHNLKKVGKFIPLSGCLDEISYVFIAKDLEFVGQKLEASEDGMEITEIDIGEAYRMLDNGEIIDGQTMTALSLARKYLLTK